MSKQSTFSKICFSEITDDELERMKSNGWDLVASAKKDNMYSYKFVRKTCRQK